MLSTISNISKGVKCVFRSCKSGIGSIGCILHIRKKRKVKTRISDEEWWESISGVLQKKNWPIIISYFSGYENVTGKHPPMWRYYKSSCEMECFDLSKLHIAINEVHLLYPDRPIVVSEFIGGVKNSGIVPDDVLEIIKSNADLLRSTLPAEVAVEGN